MPDERTTPLPLSAFAVALTRRRLLVGLGTSALAAGLPTAATDPVAAQEATPVASPVDQTRLNGLIDLSRTLCGGGNFDSGRATTLLGLLDGDTDLEQGLDELLAAPPVDPATATTPPAAPTAVPSSQAQTAMQAILLFWYVDTFKGDPVADRSTAYYGLTSWQSMYTPPFAVCKVFGGWANPPSLTPLVASS
jgi:hypothetical protein